MIRLPLTRNVLTGSCADKSCINEREFIRFMNLSPSWLSLLLPRVHRLARKFKCRQQIRDCRTEVVNVLLHRYDLFKTLLLRNRIPLIDHQIEDGLLLHTISSILAGTVATSKHYGYV